MNAAAAPADLDFATRPSATMVRCKPMLCSVCNCENLDGAVACRSCGSPLAGTSHDHAAFAGLHPGTKLQGAKFTVGKVLGQGGFGITYLGADTTLGRSVAIKEFFPQGCVRRGTTVCPSGTITGSDYRAAREKFVEEARVLAQFHHRDRKSTRLNSSHIPLS